VKKSRATAGSKAMASIASWASSEEKQSNGGEQGDGKHRLMGVK
jgi:hypothetical protein